LLGGVTGAAQQRGRKLVTAIERAQIEERKLNQEWLRLEYEQRNLSKSARIRDVARNQLNMSPISPNRTIYLREER
jgi:cell division protein FtsL